MNRRFISLCTIVASLLGSCIPVIEIEDCFDHFDNDGNGLADCNDEECTDTPWCQAIEGFRYISQEPYFMGSPEDEEGRALDEVHHQVTLSSNWWMQGSEVNQELFFAVTGWNPSANIDCMICPVDSISWFDATAFANLYSSTMGLAPAYQISGIECASGALAASDPAFCWNDTDGGIAFAQVMVADPYDGSGYRLPTEAQWEWSARARSVDAFGAGEGLLASSGDDCSGALPLTNDAMLDDMAWYCGNSINRTHASGNKDANGFGLVDIRGNVREWVWDWYEPFVTDAVVDPVGPVSGTHRVVRGGAFDSTPAALRNAARASARPEVHYGQIGMRLMLNEASSQSLPSR